MIWYFIFVDDWNGTPITTSTFILYIEKLYTRDTLKYYQNLVRSQYQNKNNDLASRKNIDMERSMSSHKWIKQHLKQQLCLIKSANNSQNFYFNIIYFNVL